MQKSLSISLKEYNPRFSGLAIGLGASRDTDSDNFSNKRDYVISYLKNEPDSASANDLYTAAVYYL